MKTSITTICRQYLEVFPQERDALKPLRRQLKERGEETITNPATVTTGHLTASILLVSLPSKRVLFMDHVALQMQIQPSGHIEIADETLMQAAYREAREETGLPVEAITYVPLTEQDHEVPFDIVVRTIPDGAEEDKPEHHHYDFCYLFVVPDAVTTGHTGGALPGRRWVEFVDFAEDPTYSQQAEKVEKLLLG